MRLLIAISMLLYFGFAGASDKDVLRDACGGVKASQKRAECFDALDRISTPPKAPEPMHDRLPDVLPLSIRGVECEAFEFGELDSMKIGELAGLYCSYGQGSSRALDSARKLGEQYPDSPRVRSSLLGEGIRSSERCTRGMARASDVLRRRLQGEKVDCAHLAVPTKTAQQ